MDDLVSVHQMDAQRTRANIWMRHPLSSPLNSVRSSHLTEGQNSLQRPVGQASLCFCSSLLPPFLAHAESLPRSLPSLLFHIKRHCPAKAPTQPQSLQVGRKFQCASHITYLPLCKTLVLFILSRSLVCRETQTVGVVR